MIKNKYIDNYILKTCHFLNIEPPKVSYDTSHFPTLTTWAQASSDGTEIYLQEPQFVGENELDYLFALTHELRHIWQIRNDRDKWLGDYKQRCECDLETYNLQPAEIDANAFAAYYIEGIFGAKSLFNGLSESVIEKMEDRKREIFREMIGI